MWAACAKGFKIPPRGTYEKERGELTLRAEEAGARRNFIDTTHVEDHRWRPPQVDANSHAFCQAIHQGIEGQEWEALYDHSEELHQAVRTRKPRDYQKGESCVGHESGKRERRIIL